MHRTFLLVMVGYGIGLASVLLLIFWAVGAL